MIAATVSALLGFRAYADESAALTKNASPAPADSTESYA
jgi:hypothetical protein